MPFTAAHTVAVLPFVRNRALSATALVAGSMSPDFEYFIRIGVKGIWGHDLLGILMFDLPMTLLMAAVFHLIVKRNLIENCPAFLQRRIGNIKSITFKEDFVDRPITFALCAIFGALTHVLWDGFTHNGGYFVQTLTWLYEARSIPFRGANYPLWYVLQQVSTAFGLVVLIAYGVRLKPIYSATRPSILYWILLLIVTTIVVAIRFQFPHEGGLPIFVIATISGLCIGVIILGLFLPRKQISSQGE